MAVVAATVTPLGNDANQNQNGPAHLVTWASMANGDTGAPIQQLALSDRTVQVVGTFGVGGSVTLKGSNDGTNYVALTDPQGNAITMTAAGLEAVSELPRYVRPEVTAGDGTTSLSVYLLLGGPRR